MSKHLVMSSSMNHFVDVNVFRTSFRAVIVPRQGLYPCELSINFFSNEGSITVFMASCTILSLNEGIPSGLFPPFGFLMYILLLGEHWYAPLPSARDKFCRYS